MYKTGIMLDAECVEMETLELKLYFLLWDIFRKLYYVSHRTWSILRYTRYSAVNAYDILHVPIASKTMLIIFKMTIFLKKIAVGINRLIVHRGIRVI